MFISSEGLHCIIYIYLYSVLHSTIYLLNEIWCSGLNLAQLAQEISCILDKSQVTNAVTQKQKHLQRISQKLSDQIVYCQAVTWDEEILKRSRCENPSSRAFRQMSSIGESKIQKYLEYV